MTQSYRDLIVWQKAYSLCLEVYKAAKDFPRSEEYGLTSQLRRCSVSIPSNIAEGYNRKGRKEYVQFLHTAYGSLAELQTQLMLAKDIGYLPSDHFAKLYEGADEVGKMLWKMIDSLKASS
jgi:four helix bundle protein